METILSVITINKNNASGLEKTIQSVLQQTYSNYEFIVIDGNSTDNSKTIIEKYSNQIHYSVSEPDNGIYEAMNKGIKQATGKYCLFLNSGDCLATISILQIVNDEINNEDIIYGDILLDQDYKMIPYAYTDNLTIKYLLKYVIPHQATFIKKELFEKCGLYDPTYKIVGDWAWILNCFVSTNINYRHIPKFISIYDTTGLSFNKENEKFIVDERKKAIQKIFNLYMVEYITENMELEEEIRIANKKNYIISLFRKLL